MSNSVELYNHAYGNFDSAAQRAVRVATFGQDIGQTSWMTVDEWLSFADQLGVRAGSEVLEVGSGSGGPACYLAEARQCQVTGVDVNTFGVANGNRLAHERGLSDRVRCVAVKTGAPLPFPAAAFDAIVANDVICHIGDRLASLRDWHRLLRPGGRLLFSDALVITGPVSHDEIALRSSIGFFLFVPPGENERLIGRAGLTLLEVRDLTDAPATIAPRRRTARESQRELLIEQEGEETFAHLQRYLQCVQQLAAERRLSRFSYVAECPKDRG